MDIKELKEQCEQNRKSVEKLYGERTADIIESDIKNYMAIHPDEITGENKKYVLHNSIDITVSNDGILNIIDERGEAYMWIFDIELGIKNEDYLIIERKLETVRLLSDAQLMEHEEEIEKVIDQLKQSMVKLKSSEPFANYLYRCSKPYKEYLTIDEVLNDVVNRTPRERRY